MRSDIARDLHDEIGSSLSSIKMMTSMALGQGQITDKVQPLLERVQRYATETVEKMSDIVWMIKPDGEGRQPLSDRIRKVMMEVEAGYGMEVHTLLHEPVLPQMDLGRKRNVYLIFKEAINNALKYASATKLSVTMAITETCLILEIRDDGKGFDTNSERQGNGLGNMQRRASEMGGRLDVHSTPAGTSVRMELPLL
jgi:signal transduction histidine kinase